ncbi:hypothetical protein [Novosphingobium lentum]|uniref:hypothetical protein n=1 Tax=Novosphingobium lentum TaxID=145287 RepID=UPI000830F217|nr:hypothetical protein [Novosphingobium lentum]
MQRPTSRFIKAGGGGIAAVAALLLVTGQAARTADHLDPPARTDPAVDSTPDTPADIADVFTWYDATNVNFVITFAGPSSPTQPAFYDRDVLYTLNLSTQKAGTTADIPITFRFGKGAGANDFGIQASGIPGVTGTLEGPVESTLTKSGVSLRAGLFDDPFFFDLQGFKDTKSTGTLMFNKTRNFFDGKNDTAIVLSIPRANFTTSNISAWFTTARFGGQL